MYACIVCDAGKLFPIGLSCERLDQTKYDCWRVESHQALNHPLPGILPGGVCSNRIAIQPEVWSMTVMLATSSISIRLEARILDQSSVDHSGLQLEYAYASTPLGGCFLAESAGRVAFLAFGAEEDEEAIVTELSRCWPGASIRPNSESAGRRIEEIFERTTRGRPEVKLLLQGTSFQVDVWKALLAIPFGQMRTYAEIAENIGRPRATRAVGSAIGANPIAWLIPCHRVIRSDGQLGGYRWGLDVKKACLDFEKGRLS